MGKPTIRDLAAKGPTHAAASHDRDNLSKQFHDTRALTLTITDPLPAEDLAIQTMADVSPTKWHMAHTSWFFETFLLKQYQSAYAPYHDAFEFLFNSYYNAVGDQFPRPERGLLSRPTADEIRNYRAHVDAAMAQLIAQCDDKTWNAVAPLIELGVHHEQQHQELILTDLKHVLSWNPLKPSAYGTKPKALKKSLPLEFKPFNGGILQIGHDGGGFAFDCETPRHDVLVRPFSLASRPVTNGEFLEFIQDDGYETPHLWLSDGWAELQQYTWQSPLYWSEEDGEWSEFTLHGLQKLDLEEPVSHISFYEACAYAAWAGARLPMEHELETAAGSQNIEGNFLNTNTIHPQPGSSVSSIGLSQIYGDVWEWTQSAYSAYPGFAPAAGAVGEYNGKFMCNQFVLKGGSCATPMGHMRPTYRNFFPPNARWQFSGVRLAKDI